MATEWWCSVPTNPTITAVNSAFVHNLKLCVLILTLSNLWSLEFWCQSNKFQGLWDQWLKWAWIKLEPIILLQGKNQIFLISNNLSIGIKCCYKKQDWRPFSPTLPDNSILIAKILSFRDWAVPSNTEQCWAMLNNTEQCRATPSNAEQS